MEKEIKIAIVGIGNCASSLIQGIGYYFDKDKSQKPNGLMHYDICGYKIKNIKVVSAFDINIKKIGKKISEAIFIEPNCTKTFYNKKSLFNNKVLAGPILDSVTERVLSLVKEHKIKRSLRDWRRIVVKELIDKKVDVLISYLPVGSKKASLFYADCAIGAKIGFINAIPEFICSSKEWSESFKKVGMPCAGDDIKSQVGATILHRSLISLINSRGEIIDNTFQLNIGGNTDFLNMLDEERLSSKRISKTEAITKIIKEYEFDSKIGPSDYIAHLKDNKICFIEINGRQFGNIPFKLEVKLSVEDSPNSAGVMVDVIRLLKVAIDRKLSGYQDFSSYYFKHPMFQYEDDNCRNIVEKFINDKFL